MPLLRRLRFPDLTIFGRSLLLIILELFTNALFWVIAGVLFGRNNATRPVLNLALLAWVCMLNLHIGALSQVNILSTDPGAEARYAYRTLLIRFITVLSSSGC
jgi:hypothetical protein